MSTLEKSSPPLINIEIPFPVPKESIIGIIYGKGSPGHKIYKIKGKIFDLRNAVDIFAPKSTPVLAVDNGKVIKVCKNVTENYPNVFNPANVPEEKEDGNYVAIAHENNLISFYAHLKYKSVCVDKGEKIKKGEKIGEVGNTGLAGVHPKFGKYHLHFYIGKWIGNTFSTFPVKFI